jgi:hypothetical protein
MDRQHTLTRERNVALELVRVTESAARYMEDRSEPSST